MMSDDPRAAAIIALDEQRRAAMIAADFAALDRLLAEELIHVHAGGNADTKQQYFELIETLCEFVAIERGPMTRSDFMAIRRFSPAR